MQVSEPDSGKATPLVTRREIVPVVAWALVIAALTALPYVWAVERAPMKMQFEGFIWGVDEGNVYLAWMRQAAEGRVLLRNQYTTLPQNPHFFNVFLLALGRITALTGQPPAIIFHAARLVGGVVLLLSIYLFAAFVTRSRAVRWATLCLASLGSGLGWLAAGWAQSRPEYLPPALTPPDYAPPPPHSWQVMPEAVTFLSLLLNPLFVWSMALMCLVLLAAAVTVERRSLSWAALTGGLLLVIGNVHTYDVFVLHAAIVVYSLVMIRLGRADLKRAALQYAIMFSIALPAPVWAWWTAQQDPSYLQKILTQTLSPPPLDLAMGYGLVLALAMVGGVYAIGHRRDHPRLLLPLCWAGVNLPLLYLPVSFQRKLAEGLHIPLCVLAAVGLVMVIAQWLATPPREMQPVHGVLPAGARRRAAARVTGPPASRVALLIAGAVVLTMPSNALFVAGCMDNVATNNRALLSVLQPPMYLSFDEVRALDYLGRHASEDDIVLCSSLTGSYVPTRAPCLVFAGHWAETLHFADAVVFVAKFFTPGRNARVLSGAIETVGATWVIYGPQEALIATSIMREPPDDPAGQFRDATRGVLRPVFTSGDVTVYDVISRPTLPRDRAASGASGLPAPAPAPE